MTTYRRAGQLLGESRLVSEEALQRFHASRVRSAGVLAGTQVDALTLSDAAAFVNSPHSVERQRSVAAHAGFLRLMAAAAAVACAFQLRLARLYVPLRQERAACNVVGRGGRRGSYARVPPAGCGTANGPNAGARRPQEPRPTQRRSPQWGSSKRRQAKRDGWTTPRYVAGGGKQAWVPVQRRVATAQSIRASTGAARPAESQNRPVCTPPRDLGAARSATNIVASAVTSRAAPADGLIRFEDGSDVDVDSTC
jgi:hypothetical protein